MTMAKRRRRRAILGSPPTRHAHQLRKALQHLNTSLENTIRNAQQGKCAFAQEQFEEAHRWLGREEAHVESVGPHRLFLERRVNLAVPRRKVIAARKALEAHCGRPKARE
jgi:hypothetical protein